MSALIQIAALATALGARLDPPLDPSGDEARRSLRRELVRPEYYDTNILERIADWLERMVGDTVNGASNARPVAVIIAIVVSVALLASLIAIISRLRRTASTRGSGAPALTDEVLTAAELRSRAVAALAAGDFENALVDGFRATAVRQCEKGRIEDLPQATAHELARALGAAFAEHGAAIDQAADVFDLVLYGDRRASRDQAQRMLALDDLLAGSTVRR